MTGICNYQLTNIIRTSALFVAVLPVLECWLCLHTHFSHGNQMTVRILDVMSRNDKDQLKQRLFLLKCCLGMWEPFPEVLTCH